MNRQQRRKTSRRLRDYRALSKRTPEDIAGMLGWPLAFYLDAEAGKAGLSKGQVEDVRRMLKAAVASATVRDRLRGAGRPKRIPLIGGARVVEHVSHATANEEVRKLEDHMNKHGRSA